MTDRSVRPPAEEIVLYEKDPKTRIATITLNRPDRLNGPTAAARHRFADRLNIRRVRWIKLVWLKCRNHSRRCSIHESFDGRASGQRSLHIGNISFKVLEPDKFNGANASLPLEGLLARKDAHPCNKLGVIF